MNPFSRALAAPVTMALLVASGSTLAERITYCCTGDNGHQVCSDQLPPECYRKAYREINSRGLVVRKVDAPLSSAQQAAKDAEALRKKEADRQALEQKRRDNALLLSYATADDINRMRQRHLAPHQEAIKDLQGRLDLAIKGNKDEQQDLRKLIAGHQEDIAAINARFDADLKRFRELTGTAAGGSAR